MFARSDIYFRLHLLLIIIHITCISQSLRRTSAPIHLKSVLGVLGTQETSCIVIAGLLERDSFDILLPEFDKPWVIHLRETCCCSTNLCTWRPNTIYKNRSVRRHQPPPEPTRLEVLLIAIIRRSPSDPPPATSSAQLLAAGAKPVASAVDKFALLPAFLKVLSTRPGTRFLSESISFPWDLFSILRVQ
jgi:hypothetical protein